MVLENRCTLGYRDSLLGLCLDTFLLVNLTALL